MSSLTDEEEKLLEAALGKLLENFDTVRIFVTRHDGGANVTHARARGGGNAYAQEGQIAEWLSLQAAAAVDQANKERDEDDD